MGRSSIWLFSGLAVAGALAALSMAAEQTWLAGHPFLADLIGVCRLAVYWLWCVPAWRFLRDAERRLLVHVGHTTLAAGLVITVLT
jgi:hypothetical protein